MKDISTFFFARNKGTRLTLGFVLGIHQGDGAKVHLPMIHAGSGQHWFLGKSSWQDRGAPHLQCWVVRLWVWLRLEKTEIEKRKGKKLGEVSEMRETKIHECFGGKFLRHKGNLDR